jgi:hypothetical protein
MKHERLLNEIRAAFPAEAIVAAGAFEERGIAYCDGADYMDQMNGKTWEQLDPQYLARRSDALDFLGGSQLIAVLPMYLQLLLVLEPTSPVPETLLPLLTKAESTDEPVTLFEWQTRRFEQLTRGLSDHQRRLVAMTLLRFIELYPTAAAPARRALERYWHTFVQR